MLGGRFFGEKNFMCQIGKYIPPRRGGVAILWPRSSPYSTTRVRAKNTIVWGNSEKTLKDFDENSMEELNLYLFSGKVVATNRAFRYNIIFLQQSFPVGGV